MEAPFPPSPRPRGLAGRLLSRRAAGMLARNTIVSCGVILLNLILLWLFVEQFGMQEVPAAAIGFIIANSLQYAFGRTWIFRGTERGVGSGYFYFFVNAGIGLVIMLSLFALLLEYTSIHYLAARVIVSVFSGLTVFLLNAMLNFRSV